MSISIAKALEEMFWLVCLLLGIVLMIVGVTEGVPFTSFPVRDEMLQLAIGAVGLFLALLGVYIGFRIGKRRKITH
jgi:putative Mn2+ efflux pump MntP